MKQRSLRITLNNLICLSGVAVSKPSIRFLSIDIVRIIAIIFMVIFHLIYDLHLFNFKFIPRSFSPFWIYFPRLIVFLFLLAVGMSIGVSTKSPSFVKYIKSQKKLFAACLIVSLTTYFVFPSRWIYFGTLHCIFACKVLLFSPKETQIFKFIIIFW